MYLRENIQILTVMGIKFLFKLSVKNIYSSKIANFEKLGLAETFLPSLPPPLGSFKPSAWHRGPNILIELGGKLAKQL